MSPLLLEERDDSPARPNRAPESPARVETRRSRVVGGVVVVLVATLLLAGLLRVWSPAHPGVDQNGYLVGGKLLALTGSPGFAPGDPYWFVGAMWNLGPDGETYYPKYPLGLPAVYAALILFAGVDWGTWLSHLVSPVSTALAVIGVYALARPLVGVFGGLLSAIVLAVSPVTFSLATNPNSHAATLACAVWGMVGLFAWWRSGGASRAAATGLLLGYAVTIRYTEGLMLLPLALAGLDRCRTTGWSRSSVGQVLLMLAAWAVPVGLLVGFNVIHFGVLTGYDTTRESTGFGWAYFAANWDLMLRELDDKALGLLFGLGVAGMGMMIATRQDRRQGVLLAAWGLPCVLAYSAYYWAPETTGVGYARFVLTVLPAFVVPAIWVLTEGLARVLRSSAAETPRAGWQAAVSPMMTGAVVALAAANLASLSAESGVAENRGSLVVDVASNEIRKVVPAGSTVFAEARLLHHLQFVGDFAIYAPDVFSRAAVLRLGDVARTDDPHPLQPQRAAALYARLKDYTEARLIAEQNRLMDKALAQGRRVFMAGPLTQVRDLRRRFAPESAYGSVVRAQWQEPGDFRRSRWQRTGNDPPPWATRRLDLRPAEIRGVLWQVVEILPKPPATAPATAPSAGPRPASRAAARNRAPTTAASPR